MAIFWKSRVILAKMESSYGVDSTPAAANAMLLTDVTLSPMEGEDVSRNLERHYQGGQEELPVGLNVVLTGSVELVGSGTAGVAPKWGPLARACKLAETIVADVSVAYTPVSENHESLSAYMWVGGTRYVLRGARGNATIMLNAQGIPHVRFALTGLFTEPSEVTRVTPDYTGWSSPQVATKANTPTFTLGGVAMVLRSFELNMGNDVQKRFLIGKEEILIVDNNAQLACTVEAVPLTTFNPFARAVNQTATAVNLVHGATAGKIATIAATNGKLRRLTGLENQQNIKEWPLRIGLVPASGNDDFSITLT